MKRFTIKALAPLMHPPYKIIDNDIRVGRVYNVKELPYALNSKEISIETNHNPVINKRN